MIKYKDIAKKYELKDDEMLLFTNLGIFKIDTRDFNRLIEELSISRGEQGLHFEYFLVITNFLVTKGEEQIYNCFTNDIDECFYRR